MFHDFSSSLQSISCCWGHDSHRDQHDVFEWMYDMKGMSCLRLLFPILLFLGLDSLLRKASRSHYLSFPCLVSTSSFVQIILILSAPCISLTLHDDCLSMMSLSYNKSLDNWSNGRINDSDDGSSLYGRQIVQMMMIMSVVVMKQLLTIMGRHLIEMRNWSRWQYCLWLHLLLILFLIMMAILMSIERLIDRVIKSSHRIFLFSFDWRIGSWSQVSSSRWTGSLGRVARTTSSYPVNQASLETTATNDIHDEEKE